MFKRIGVVIVGIMVLLSASAGYAQYKRIKAIGVVETNRKRPKIDEKKQALEDAKRKALDKYIDSLDSQRIRILNNLKDELYSNINVYVPEISTLNDGNWRDGYWKVNVEASINEAQIEELVNKYTRSNIQQKEESYISFVFVAREVGSVREYTGKKTERTVETEGYKVSEGETEEGGEVGEAKNIYEKVTGGSVEKKSERLKYRGYSPEEIEAKVIEVFNKADFEVVPIFDIDIDSDRFAEDFAEKDKITNATKKEAVSLAKDAGIHFLAVSTLDVGRDQIDQATGLHKIYVRVTGYIWDLRGKFTKKIASIGPVQYSGLGENPKVAKVNALINASTKAAKDLVDQLRAKEGM